MVKMIDDRFNEWNKWVDVIYLEITRMSRNRNIFLEVHDIIKNNPKIQKPSSFYKFLGSTYADSALMRVRRQVKIDKDSISFARLLKEICDTPEILSRNRFFNLYKGSTVEQYAESIGSTVEQYASRDFDKFAGKGENHVNPELIKLDSEKLKTKAKNCEKYADQRVAHFDKRAMNNIPTFADLDDCIDFLEKLMKKYYLLFRAECLTSILPVYQNNWKAIFREAWLP
jgi:hypothetical protein